MGGEKGEPDIPTFLLDSGLSFSSAVMTTHHKWFLGEQKQGRAAVFCLSDKVWSGKMAKMGAFCNRAPHCLPTARKGSLC